MMLSMRSVWWTTSYQVRLYGAKDLLERVIALRQAESMVGKW